MSPTEHTRAPWIAVEREGYGEREIHGAEDENGYRLIIAIVCNAPGEENLANARVLAAAPELLKSAKMALDALSSRLDRVEYEALESAIEKAQGN